MLQPRRTLLALKNLCRLLRAAFLLPMVHWGIVKEAWQSSWPDPWVLRGVAVLALETGLAIRGWGDLSGSGWLRHPHDELFVSRRLLRTSGALHQGHEEFSIAVAISAWWLVCSSLCRCRVALANEVVQHLLLWAHGRHVRILPRAWRMNLLVLWNSATERVLAALLSIRRE